MRAVVCTESVPGGSPKAKILPWPAAAAAGLDSKFDPTANINAAITQAAQANGNRAVNNAAVRDWTLQNHTPLHSWVLMSMKPIA